MNKDIAEGKVKQVKGKMKEEIGKATGDESMEIEGQTEHLTGHIQEEYGKIKQSVKKAIEL